MIKFNSIFCPVDVANPQSQMAIDFAAKLADADTIIHLFCVAEIPTIADTNGFIYVNDFANKITEYAQNDLNEFTEQVKLKYANHNFDAKLAISTDTAEAIIQEAANQSADIIIMNSHARKGLNRILMGSVAETVMRTAACPVIIVKNNKATKK